MRTPGHAVFFLVLTLAQSAHAQTIEGVLVAIDPIDGRAALEAARTAGGARWSLERLTPRRSTSAAPPSALVLRLREAYLAADFLRCLTALSEPALDLDALLEAGHRGAAADTAVFGAACAFGAGDTDLARRLVSRAFVAELDVRAALAVTTPDFQETAEQVRAALAGRERVSARIESRPAGARVLGDGGRARCRPTPCTLTLVPGLHAIDVSRLGYAPRTLRVELERDQHVRLALDPAPSSAVRRELGAALASGLDPGDIELARVASNAFEARVVVVAWSRRGAAHALVYDRARDRVLARIAARGRDAAASAVRSVIAEWRGITEPTPIYEEPLFWGITGAATAVAIGVGILVYFLARPPERRYDLVFVSPF